MPTITAGVTPKGRGRIKVDVDPMVTPRRLASAYQQVRREVFQGRRLRALTSKHLALALFFARHQGETWDQMRNGWNAAVSRSEHYSAAAAPRFRRDAIDAARRLDAARVTLSTAMHWIFDAEAGASQGAAKDRGKSRPPRRR